MDSIPALGPLLLLLAAALAPAAAAAQPPEQLGPFWLGDASARVRPSLFLQLEGSGRTAPDADMQWDLRIRRIRPILRASFLEDRITATLHLEVAPSAPELIDAWVGGRVIPELSIRAGQMKTPFTRYYQRQLIELAVDWPLTSRWLGGERQLGVMVHGAHSQSGLSYAVGGFSGQNRRNAFARELARVYGERLGNPSSFASPAPTDPIHPELIARVDHEGTTAGLRHTASLSAAWDSDPVARRDYALRVAPELDLELEGWRATMVGYAGWFEDASGGVDLGVMGLLGELAWRAHRHVELVLRHARVHALPALLADARAHAETMHAALDQADWESRYGGVGRRHAWHELALAVNVLIFGRSLAWQNDVTWLRVESSGGAQDDLRIRTQLQLAF